MRRNMQVMGMIAGMMAGGLSGGLNFVHPSEPSRGWNGFLGSSKNGRPKHTNKLRCKHNSKLKRRKGA